MTRSLVALLLLAAAGGAPVVAPHARVQTDPILNPDDSADDPAVWHHPTDPARGAVIGTNKKGGLHVYDFDGRELHALRDDARPDNVDVVYGFRLGGRLVDLAVAGCRGPKACGVKVYAIDPEARSLTDVTAGGVIPAFGGQEPYGSCTYRSPKTGRFYYFVNHKAKGGVEQYELVAEGDRVAGRKVREFEVGSIAEGCVCDEELGHFYIAQEDVGIWKYAAEPDGGDARTCVARVGEHGLKDDIEGLAIYYAAGGRGYLIASSQGNDTFKVFEREGNNRFVLTIDPAGGAIDDVSDTDGIAVTNRPCGPRFPKGMFVVQDGEREGGGQNFKLYGWEDVAGGRLLVDPAAAVPGR